MFLDFIVDNISIVDEVITETIVQTWPLQSMKRSDLKLKKLAKIVAQSAGKTVKELSIFILVFNVTS